MLKFFKMHGIGNDYIFVDNTKNNVTVNFCSIAKTLSNRHYGIGSDGLVVISKHNFCDAKMEIYNRDGSQAKLCGNATRCVAFYLSKKLKKDNITIFCHNKILQCKVKKISNQKAIVCVAMGMAKILKQSQSFFVVDIGNKHLVILVKKFDFNIKDIGKKLSKKFDANVEFVKILSPSKIQIKVYERGSGVTLACGSGACACCYVANKLFGLKNKIQATLDGGNLLIKIGKNLQMIGECKFVYSGEVLC